MVDITRPISSKRLATFFCVLLSSSCLSVISEKSEFVLPMALILPSISIMRLDMAYVITSNSLIDLVIFKVIPKKKPIATSKHTQIAPSITRECNTLRRLVSSILATTMRMAELTSAAMDAERVDTSAESKTTEVSSSIWRATSLLSKDWVAISVKRSAVASTSKIGSASPSGVASEGCASADSTASVASTCSTGASSTAVSSVFFSASAMVNPLIFLLEHQAAHAAV